MNPLPNMPPRIRPAIKSEDDKAQFEYMIMQSRCSRQLFVTHSLRTKLLVGLFIALQQSFKLTIFDFLQSIFYLPLFQGI